VALGFMMTVASGARAVSMGPATLCVLRNRLVCCCVLILHYRLVLDHCLVLDFGGGCLLGLLVLDFGSCCWLGFLEWRLWLQVLSCAPAFVGFAAGQWSWWQ
jgi:hypothetical protein